MKRQFILVFVLLVSSIALNAANSVPDDDKSDNKNKTEVSSAVETTWGFCSAIRQPSVEALANVASYKFRQETGYLYDQFMNIYVAREEVVPGDPIRRIVTREPTIYNAVRSTERQLNRELKNNKMEQEQVAAESTNILKIATFAFNSETELFEDALQQNRKSAAALLPAFQNIKLIDV